MSTVIERLAAARAAAKDRHLAALIVTTGDPHMSEYLPENWALRRYLSGFTGSAGTLVVTDKEALLWTDSRYWDQAARETEGTGITVMKTGMDGVPTPRAWLFEQLPEGSTAGVDFATVAAERMARLEAELAVKSIAVEDAGDLTEALWPERPARSAAPVRVFTTAQQPAAEKLATIRQTLKEKQADALFLSSLDDIAWTLNLRGSDVLHTPVFVSFLLVTQENAVLFIDEAKVASNDVKAHLAAAGVATAPYDSVWEALEKLTGDVLLDKARTSAKAASLLAASPDVRLLPGIQPTTILKSRKTTAELDALRDAMVIDGVALAETFAWVAECDADAKAITELDVADFLHEARAKNPDFFDESFTTIAAWGPNAAEPHYTPQSGTAAQLKQDSVLLVDSGAQYAGGTTDVTRTVAIGRPTAEMKRDFTAVLRGHIAIATTRFPKGVFASQLDTLARTPLWEIGADFGHGTGHGVGFHLSVHEGPAHISPRCPTEESSRIVPGLVLSNEPGLYRTGRWGIRTENLVTPVAADAEPDEMMPFLTFETLTLCPIDWRLITTAMMTPYEIWWVNDYHRRVKEALTNRLSPRAQRWLNRATDIM